MEHQHPIPVICDRCRAQGQAGEDPFAAFGALLDFEPVPRFSARADGWDAEVQRAYIAALSLTGSDRAACRAVGKSAFGVKQLIAHEGAEGFCAAREEALALAPDERSRRLADGLRTVAAEQADWHPPAPPWASAATRRLPSPPPEEEPMTDEQKKEWLADIVQRYLYKVKAERECRLAGKIVAADYYLRQLTWIEVALDLLSSGGFQLLKDFRKGEHPLVHIAETPFSRILGEARRRQWREMGEPPRPEHPPRAYLKEHDGFSTEPLEFLRGGPPPFQAQQKREFEERHARDAEAQLAWEAEARQDYERRRQATPLIDEEPGWAGQPSPEGDRTEPKTTEGHLTNSVRDGQT
jgi:hypothetical protein